MQNIRRSEGNSDWRENARNGRMTKYAQTLLVSLCSLMLCLPVASSAEVKTDAQWKYSVTDDGVEILLYRGNDTSVCVPGTIEGSKVYSIGANAFKQKNVTSIEIPEGVSSIGRSAFEECRQLKEVKLPNTLEKLLAEARRKQEEEYVALYGEVSRPLDRIVWVVGICIAVLLLYWPMIVKKVKQFWIESVCECQETA